MRQDIPNKIRILLFIYILCFLSGGVHHWLDIIKIGIFPYRNVPFIFNLYLTSLAIFDFVVIWLICVRPIMGLLLAMVIMLSDLVVDSYVGYKYWNISLSTNLGLQLVVAFGIFVFISSPMIIKLLIKYRDEQELFIIR